MSAQRDELLAGHAALSLQVSALQTDNAAHVDAHAVLARDSQRDVQEFKDVLKVAKASQCLCVRVIEYQCAF